MYEWSQSGGNKSSESSVRRRQERMRREREGAKQKARSASGKGAAKKHHQLRNSAEQGEWREIAERRKGKERRAVAESLTEKQQ